MLCHRGPVKDVVVDATGQLMATAGVDGRVSIWDLRTYKALQTYYTQRPVEHLDISQTGLLATAWNNHVHVCFFSTPNRKTLINIWLGYRSGKITLNKNRVHHT